MLRHLFCVGSFDVCVDFGTFFAFLALTIRHKRKIPVRIASSIQKHLVAHLMCSVGLVIGDGRLCWSRYNDDDHLSSSGMELESTSGRYLRNEVVIDACHVTVNSCFIKFFSWPPETCFENLIQARAGSGMGSGGNLVAIREWPRWYIMLTIFRGRRWWLKSMGTSS